MTIEGNIQCSLLSKTVYQATSKAVYIALQLFQPQGYQPEIKLSDVKENCLKVRRWQVNKVLSVTFIFHCSA